jgi:integrase
MVKRERGTGSKLKRCEHPKSAWARCAHPWAIVVSLGRDPETGKARQQWAPVRGTATDAERELRQLLGQVDSGSHIAGHRQSLAEYLDDWLEHMRTRVRPATWNRYAYLLHRDVVPVIGDVELGKIRPIHVQAVVDAMGARGLAARTTLQCYRVLSSALRQAVRWQLIGTNPANAVQPPRIERAKLTVLDSEGLAKLLKAARGTDLELPVLLAATTGLRRGELCGIRWSDIEKTTEGTVVRVTGSVQRVAGKLVRVDPKTQRARRTVGLPEPVADRLRHHRKEQTERRLALGKSWADNGLVLERGDGGAVDPDHLTHGVHKLGEAQGFKGLRLHDLRHAYASTLLRHGVHPKIVSEALGHASAAFTMDVYQHITPTLQRAAADAIEAELGL